MNRALFLLHQVVITVVLLIMAALYGAPPVQAQTFTYVHTDALGSPVAKTNASKAIVSITRYEPYGMTWAGNAPTIGFTGHVNDADTGLTYMQQRYYDPLAGRLLSIDPVTTDTDTGSSFNRYEYAHNNPYKFVDPDGRNPLLKLLLRAVIKTESKQVAKETAKGAAREVEKSVAKEVTKDAAKSVPNPHGKAGGPAHQEKVADVAKDVESRGLTVEKELKINTPGGKKETRYVDVAGKNAEGKVTEMHQVGKQNQNGTPVAREVKAMDDIQGATGQRPTYHPYN